MPRDYRSSFGTSCSILHCNTKRCLENPGLPSIITTYSRLFRQPIRYYSSWNRFKGGVKKKCVDSRAYYELYCLSARNLGHDNTTQTLRFRRQRCRVGLRRPPISSLTTEDASQRRHDLREVLNALRWLVRTGSPWRLMPHDLPARHAVYDQTRRWPAAGCFEAIVRDLRVLKARRIWRTRLLTSLRQRSASIISRRTDFSRYGPYSKANVCP